MRFFDRISKMLGSRRTPSRPDFPRHVTELDREVSALYSLMMDVMGSDRMVIQAGRMDALKYMRSSDPGERILEENPTLGPVPSTSEIPAELLKLSEDIADIMARRNLEDKIERKITEKLEQDHNEYVKDIRMQVLRE